MNFTDPLGLDCKNLVESIAQNDACELPGISSGGGGGAWPFSTGRESGASSNFGKRGPGAGIFGGGGGFGGGGAGGSWGHAGEEAQASGRSFPAAIDPLQLAVVLAEYYQPLKLVYAPKQWKTDKFHGFPRSYDRNIILSGRVAEVKPDGYVLYTMPGTIGRYVGRYEIGGHPLNTGEPGMFITHRFFRKGAK